MEGEQGKGLERDRLVITQLRTATSGDVRRAPSKSLPGEGWESSLCSGLFSEKHVVPQRSGPRFRGNGGEGWVRRALPVLLIWSFVEVGCFMVAMLQER